MTAPSSTSTPFVSILIRSMNRPSLAESFVSVVQQTYSSHCQLIVVNASGEEHTPLSDYNLPANLPVKLIEPREALPRAAAANMALNACTTDYAIFLDDDDLLEKNHIKHLVNALNLNPDAPAVYSGTRIDTGEESRNEVTEWQDDILFIRNFLPIHSVLFRMSAIRQYQCQFDAQFDLLEDWDFWLQLYQAGKFVCSPIISAIYRIHLGRSGLSTNRNITLFRASRKKIYSKWFDRLSGERFANLLDALSNKIESLSNFRGELAKALDLDNDSALHIIAYVVELNCRTQSFLSVRDELLQILKQENDSSLRLIEAVVDLNDQAESFLAMRNKLAEILNLTDNHSENLVDSVAEMGHKVTEMNHRIEYLQAFHHELANILGQQGKTPLALIEFVTDLKNEHAYYHKELSEIRSSLWYKGFAATRRLKNLYINKVHPAKTLTPKESLVRPDVVNTRPNGAIDVIIPVYKGLDETRACLESALNSKNKTPCRIIVINDASPEPEVTQWLREAATKSDFALLENEQNLGFVKTVNRGMRASNHSDVILLNSDTEVADYWLDRLAHTAYHYCNDKPVGTVTPFSNNATICSYPRFCEDNQLPNGYDLQKLDQLCAVTLKGQMVEVPTAVGFCMYIRRDCLTQVGFFDEEHFGRGYGEENDFCMRAIDKGWVNVHALDTFVWHKGSVSFGVDQQPLHVQKASKVIDQLHPHYHALVHDFVGKDPAFKARIALDLARIRQSEAPTVLMVSHQRGGGTELHCNNLAALHPEINWLMLTPDTNGHVVVKNHIQKGAIELRFDAVSERHSLVQLLKYLRVDRIHWHHWLGLPDSLRNLAEALSVPQDITLHDFYAICPQISLSNKNGQYCGEEGLEQCTECLQHNHSTVNIEQWRDKNYAWLKQFDRIFVPSADSKQRVQHYYPELNIKSVYHYEAHPEQSISWTSPSSDEPLRVALIGALSINKGAVVLEQAAQFAKKHNLPINFQLFGYAYRALDENNHLNCTGAYQEEDLPNLLADWKPHIVWFPTQAPETYSYTLSTCLALGLPIVCTDIGAQAERIASREYSWILSKDTSAEQWCSWLMGLSDPGSSVFDQMQSKKNKEKGEIITSDLPSSFYLKDYSDVFSAEKRKNSSLGNRSIFENGNVLESDSTQAEQWISSFLQSGEITNHIPAQNQSFSLRKRTVDLLFWLKSRPLLRGVVQLIPPSTQRKIKSMILGEL